MILDEHHICWIILIFIAWIISTGLAAGLAPMYLTEISPIHLRGAVGTIYQLIIVIAILTSNILGFPSLLGTESLWPMLFGITWIAAIR